jgi:hypothetical protein
MADLLFPDVRIQRCAPKLMDNTARFSSPFTQATRTLARPGDRWGFSLSLNDLQGFDRSRVETFIAGMRGGANRAIFAPVDYTQRGSFSCPELNPNSNFSSTLNWTPTGATFTVADRQARVQSSGAAVGRINNTVAIPTTIGVSYVARFIAYAGNQSVWRTVGGTTTGAGDLFGLTPSTIGYIATPFTATGTTFFFGLYSNTTVAGDFITYVLASLTRCALVNGASQTGSTLIIDALPISTAGLLLPGDWIGIGMEQKRITAPLNSDSGGNGLLQFAPPLRVSPANNDPVIITSPMGRFILAANENGWESVPGIFSTYTFDLVEAP